MPRIHPRPELVVRYRLTLTPKMLEQLRALSVEHERSLGSEIRVALRSWLDWQQATSLNLAELREYLQKWVSNVEAELSRDV